MNSVLGSGGTTKEYSSASAAPAQHVDELVVFALSALDRDDVVEEELLAVLGSESLEVGAGPMHEHRAQPADFRVDSMSRHPRPILENERERRS